MTTPYAEWLPDFIRTKLTVRALLPKLREPLTDAVLPASVSPAGSSGMSSAAQNSVQLVQSQVYPRVVSALPVACR
ncbi:hypothetical protein ACQPZ8_32475 [Actinomadura nitritigenes]|uniref:hypothetical protein n=1 Tax=Actinomadura nitritigenes TaxID=134602 RepID=UPI003D8D94C9